MKRSLMGTCCAALLMSGAAYAADGRDVTVDLSAQRAVISAEGKETLGPASQARPGDTIEYTAVYRNVGRSTAKKLEATLPIPAGSMGYVPGSASPQAVRASVDGKTFASPPLMRTVTLPDGTRELREVPASEYRFLRWDLGELPSGKSTSVKARMRVSAVEGVSAGSTNQGDKK